MSSVVSDFVHCIGQDFTALLTGEFGKDGLTLTQIRVLDCVERLPGSTQTAICKVASVDRSTLADVVDRLVQRKLLARKDDKIDKRAWNLTITAKGTSDLAHAIAARTRAEEALAAQYPGLKKFADDVAKKRRRLASETPPRMIAAE